ncbi:hypothetical protein [Bacillus sp. Fil]|uniref:hypothetical protein n=1 Tax=Bacillus sp. Fil TaxID=3459567 RepID=UPI00403AABCD
MKYYKASHVEAVFKLFEEMSRLPEWEINKWGELHDKKNNAIAHTRKHAEYMHDPKEFKTEYMGEFVDEQKKEN